MEERQSYCVQTRIPYATTFLQKTCTKIWKKFKNEPDFSDYPTDHFLYDSTNKKVLEKMKDETMSIPMTRFVGLRPKMFSLTYGTSETRKAKGVSKSVIRSKLRHSSYRECLFQREYHIKTMVTFRSDKHQIHIIALN